LLKGEEACRGVCFGRARVECERPPRRFTGARQRFLAVNGPVDRPVGGPRPRVNGPEGAGYCAQGVPRCELRRDRDQVFGVLAQSRRETYATLVQFRAREHVALPGLDRQS
jgi:hypothetical protein